MRSGTTVALLTLPSLVTVCGGATGTAPTPSTMAPLVSTSPSPSGSPDAFAPGDCAYPARGGTITKPAPDTFETIITIPIGWTLQDTAGTDLPFLMSAPPSYR